MVVSKKKGVTPFEDVRRMSSTFNFLENRYVIDRIFQLTGFNLVGARDECHSVDH